jgi:hypothetical protein
MINQIKILREALLLLLVDLLQELLGHEGFDAFKNPVLIHSCGFVS